MLATLPKYPVLTPEHLSVGPHGIPALLVRPQADSARPAAIIQHGYGANKTDLLPFAHFLAERGFVALLPDAWGHGARLPQAGPNWMSELSADYFLEVLRHTIHDIGECLDAMEQRPDVRHDALLMAGFSMGAMAALLVGTQDPRVAAVISASGSAAPDLLSISIAGSRLAGPETCAWAREHDAAAHLARLAPRPLLLQHGTNDDLVPVANTLRLHQEATPLYANHPERLGLMLYEHRHMVSQRQIEDAAEWVAPFFAERDETAA